MTIANANGDGVSVPTVPDDPYMTSRVNYQGDWRIWVYNEDESVEDGLIPWSHGASLVPDIAYVLDPQPTPDAIRLYIFHPFEDVAMRAHAVSTHRDPPGEVASEHGPGCCTLRLHDTDPLWPDAGEDISPVLQRLEYGDIPEEAVTVVADVADAPVLRLPHPDAEEDGAMGSAGP